MHLVQGRVKNYAEKNNKHISKIKMLNNQSHVMMLEQF